MSVRWAFAGVALLAALMGTALWIAERGAIPQPQAPAIAPGAVYAATFRDLDGKPQALGQFQGRLVVLNFWATWCAPCREEMPGFSRLQGRWSGRGVQFVGISAEEPALVRRFTRELPISYPLWVGGDEVGTLSQRLGNRLGVLPHTVILDREGGVLETRIGTYAEAELEGRLATFAAK